jgi:hypothetical protein
LCFACLQAYAVDWVCSTSQSTRIAIAAAERGDNFELSQAGKLKKYRVDRLDLVQAYSGQPVLIGRQWLLVVMLPASHPDTRAAFAELGLSPEAAERMGSDTGLVDRGIRVVQTPAQLMEKVAINPPAVGYTSFFLGGRDVAPCF